MNTTLKDLAKHIIQLKTKQKRCVVAIAGPPGSGKSTLAEQFNVLLNSKGMTSCVMPMDGFHLDNTILNERGQRIRKGAQHTFDAHGFVDTVARIHANAHTVYVPVFDRDRDIAIAGVQEINSKHGIVLIEGNYLLLQDEPWAKLSDYFSYRLFLNPGIDVIEQRILERWQDAGLDQDTINRRTYENDLPNSKYVVEHSELSNTTLITQWS